MTLRGRVLLGPEGSHPVRRRVRALLIWVAIGVAGLLAVYSGRSVFVEARERIIVSLHVPAADAASALIVAIAQMRGALSSSSRSDAAGRDVVGDVLRAEFAYSQLLDNSRRLIELYTRHQNNIRGNMIERLEAARAELLDLRKFHPRGGPVFAHSLATEDFYIETVTQQLIRFHRHDAERLMRDNRRWETYSWVVLGCIVVLFAAGISIAIRRTTTSINQLLDRERAQSEALRRSEDRLQRVIDATADGIWDRDFRTGENYLSPRWKAILGYRDEELPNEPSSFFDLVHPDEKPLVEDAVKRHLEGGAPYRLEMRLRHKDGSYRWVLTRGKASHDVDGQPLRLVGTMTDISDRKQREQELQRFKGTLDQIHDCVFMFHPDTLEFFYVNRGAMNQVGYSEAELLRLHPYDIKPEFPEPRFRDLIRPLFDGTRSDLRFETLHRHRDGHEVPVGVFLQYVAPAGESPRFVAVVRDITAHKQAEATLQASEARLVEAQRMARIGSWELDLVRGGLTWSDQIYTMFEIDKGRFAASYEAFLNAVHPDDRDAINQAYTASVASRAPYQIVHRLLMADGRIKWVEEHGQTLYDAAGTPLRSTGTVQDITERKLAEDALRQTLAEREILLREIHHRVKNNLQVIASLLYFQAQKVKDPDDVTVITDGRDRLRAMTLVHEKLYQSKDLSRIEFGGYVRSLVAQLAESYKGLDPRVETRVEAGDLALPIEIALPCGMIICELLINAFKYAFPDGRDGAVAVGITGADGRLAITVSDDGVGLPEGFAADGTGSFGWQLINNLSMQIDGTISLGRGQGTAVTVSFPYPEAA